MKLSVIVDEISMDFEHALDVMLEFGVTGAEPRSLWGTNIIDLTDEQVERARSAVVSRKMTVPCIASPLLKCNLYEEGEGVEGRRSHQAVARGLDQQMDVLERCIHLCEVFDTNIIRVFAFWKQGALTDNVMEDIINAFGRPVARAEEAGVILGLENEHACYLGTGEEIAHVIKTVNSPALKAVWDPGNAYCSRGVPYPDGYEAVRDHIVHMHLKDVVWDGEKPKFVCIGQGNVDYVGQFRALKEDGYEGYLSLETHYKPDGNAEEGSRQCLASLREMLA